MLNKKKLMEMGLTEKQADKIINELNESYRPAFKFNERGEEIERLKKQVKSQKDEIKKRDDQISDIKGQIKDNEELTKKISDLEKENERVLKEAEAKVEKIKFETGLDKVLKNKYKAKNPKAVKALINIDQIKRDGEEYLGLKSQLEPLLESDGYLFNQDDDNQKGLKGKKSKIKKRDDSHQVDKNPFAKGSINLSKQAEILEADPATARNLIVSAGLDPADYSL